MSNDKGELIWITGLAGAGKSTAARYLLGKLKEKQISNVVMIDGDSIREICDNDLGYSLEDRKKNAWRIVKLCKYLYDQGVIVVCATVSLYSEIHEYIYTNFQRPKIIFLNISRTIIDQRNQKELYTSGSDVVGIDIKYDIPTSIDFVKELSKTSEVFSYLDKLNEEVHG